MAQADETYVTLELGGVPMRTVLSLRGEEELGTLFRYDVVALARPDAPPPGELADGPALITVSDPWGASRTITGVVAEATAMHRDDGTVEVRATIRPAAWLRTLGRDCRPFQDVSVVDIAKAVLAPVPRVRYELGGSYPVYPWVVQYREDDWTFLARWLETEGIYAWSDTDGALVLSDDSRTAAPVLEAPVLPFRPGEGNEADRASVLEASRFGRVASGSFAARSFDPRNPALAVQSTSGKGKHEVYDAPGGGPPDPAVLARRTATALEQAQASAAGLAGLSTSVHLVPGRTFTLVEHPAPELDGEWLVTRVVLDVRRGAPIHTRFTALAKGVPFRPARATPEAKQAGLQMGTVVGAEGAEVHPSSFGEVRVQLRWDRSGAKHDQAGTWMRVAQRGAPGSMLLPRIGWNVATFNEEGAVDAPSVLARIHDGEHPPTYPLPANMTRTTYKTATTPGGGSHNEIHFEDKRGAEVMFINASRDMSARVQNLGNEIVRNDSSRVVGSMRKVDVGASYAERVVQDRTLAVGGNETVEIAENRAKAVAGSDTITIGGKRKIDVSGAHDLSVTGNRALAVGSLMLDVSLGDVNSESTDHLWLVGGAVAKLSAADVQQQDGWIGVSAVGGAKIEIAKENHTRVGEKGLRELVGALVKVKAGERYLDTASATSAWKAGGKIAGEAPAISIQAKKKIKVTCGGTTMVIDETSITIDATKLKLSGAQLDADSDDIDHN